MADETVPEVFAACAMQAAPTAHQAVPLKLQLYAMHCMLSWHVQEVIQLIARFCILWKKNKGLLPCVAKSVPI